MKHFMPTKKTSKPLMVNGAERTITNLIGSDFVDIAKDDGEVTEIDEKLNLMTVKYKDGSLEVLDLNMNPAKNSGGGFYISNKKDTDLKVGSKFKKGDIISSNKDYFLDNPFGDKSLTPGYLTKVAITSGWFTFEDSCIVTEELADDMASYVTMDKVISLGPNTTVDDIAKKGQAINSGDPLLVFEQSIDDDGTVNEILDSLGDEFGQEILDGNKSTIKSKYTGDIVDFKLYYNVPIEDLSPSLQKIVRSYNNEINKKRNKLKKDSYVDGKILPVVEQVDPDQKVLGTEFEGVLMQFFIRYEEKMDIGAKLTASVALKSIIAEVIPYGDEPYSEHDKNENINAIISPLSIINRMVQSIMYQLYGNKMIVELKKQILDIWDE